MSAPAKIRRIAMWSGPRNISTAMMRAWENRPDTSVVDEPFYACYLNATNIVHPMQDEILASQSSQWSDVINKALNQELPAGERIQYQKHMTHHMVGDIDENWFSSVSHAFLIRHPAAVAASYSQKRDSLTVDDIGFKQQKELFDMACGAGQVPPVIESKLVLTNPRKALTVLCDKLQVPFDQHMLSWSAGRRSSDGVWAPHWYQSVEQSTGFSPYQDKPIELNRHQQSIVDQCLPYYQAMEGHAIKL